MDGQLSGVELDAVEERLRTDPEARDLLLRILQEQGLQAWSLGSRALEPGLVCQGFEKDLQRYALGRLAPRRLGSLSRHLQVCPSCQSRLEHAREAAPVLERRRRRVRVAFSAAAACAVLGLGVFLWGTGRGREPVPLVAEGSTAVLAPESWPALPSGRLSIDELDEMLLHPLTTSDVDLETGLEEILKEVDPTLPDRIRTSPGGAFLMDRLSDALPDEVRRGQALLLFYLLRVDGFSDGARGVLLQRFGFLASRSKVWADLTPLLRRFWDQARGDVFAHRVLVLLSKSERGSWSTPLWRKRLARSVNEGFTRCLTFCLRIGLRHDPPAFLDAAIAALGGRSLRLSAYDLRDLAKKALAGSEHLRPGEQEAMVTALLGVEDTAGRAAILYALAGPRGEKDVWGGMLAREALLSLAGAEDLRTRQTVALFLVRWGRKADRSVIRAMLGRYDNHEDGPRDPGERRIWERLRRALAADGADR